MSRQVSVLKDLLFTGEDTEKQAIAVYVHKVQQGTRADVGAQRRNLLQSWGERGTVKGLGICSLLLDISFSQFFQIHLKC